MFYLKSNAIKIAGLFTKPQANDFLYIPISTPHGKKGTWEEASFRSVPTP